MKTFTEFTKITSAEEVKKQIMKDVNEIVDMDEASSWVRDRIDQVRDTDSPELVNRGRLRADLSELSVDEIGNLLRSILDRMELAELRRLI